MDWGKMGGDWGHWGGLGGGWDGLGRHWGETGTYWDGLGGDWGQWDRPVGDAGPYWLCLGSLGAPGGRLRYTGSTGRVAVLYWEQRCAALGINVLYWERCLLSDWERWEQMGHSAPRGRHHASRSKAALPAPALDVIKRRQPPRCHWSQRGRKKRADWALREPMERGGSGEGGKGWRSRPRRLRHFRRAGSGAARGAREERPSGGRALRLPPPDVTSEAGSMNERDCR